MRDLHDLDQFRVTIPQYGRGNHGNGVFLIPHGGVTIKVVASNGEDWDHVSVSLPDRCPTWDEMEFVARSFFKEDETAMQLHVPPTDHVNCHPFCLHWWRPRRGVKIPRPPAWMVGPKQQAV